MRQRNYTDVRYAGGPQNKRAERVRKHQTSGPRRLYWSRLMNIVAPVPLPVHAPHCPACQAPVAS